MEMNLNSLEEDERMYLKVELYDKLDAIKEKRALRVISKFMSSYINMKFAKKRQMLKKKKNIKRTK